MKVSIQLLENYVLQQVPTIILNSGNKKYIFNMGSCFQRFVKDHQVKLPKSANYFFTKSSSSTMAGLNGFMLTIFETGSSDSKLFLNKSMFKYFQDIRYKMGFKIMPFSFYSWEEGSCHLGLRDQQLILSLIDREDYAEIFLNLDQFIKSQIVPEKVNNSKSLIDANGHFFDQQIRIIPFHFFSNGQQISNYICVAKPPQGKVFSQKIKQLKINPKDISTILQNGSITLSDGRIIKRQQIKDQTKQQSPSTLILHLNHVSSCSLIMQNQTFYQFVTSKQNFIVSVIYIVEDPAIVQTEDLKLLMKIFMPQTEHIFSAKKFKDKQIQLDEYIVPHMKRISILSQRFPKYIPNILQINKISMKNYLKGCQDIRQLFPNYRTHIAKKCYQMVLSPIKSRGYNPLNQKKDQLEPLNQLKTILNQQPMDIEYPWDIKVFNPKVLFLGTGSMKPSQHRNVSSILVQINKDNSFMLDCGQGSFYQLMNHYPQEQSDKRLLDIQVLFITHIHSDHNLGILDLISRRNKLMLKYNDKRRLYLIIPCNVFAWYNSFEIFIQNLSKGCDILFIQTIRGEQYSMTEGTQSKEVICKKQQSNKSKQSSEKSGQSQDIKQILIPIGEDLVKQFNKEIEKQGKTYQNFKNYMAKIGITQFSAIPVIHCPQSYGVVFQHQTKVKISYSGDTRPSEEFIKAATNSTLLIHQATMGDELIKNAIQNMHSTVGEAIQVGIQSGSWKTALTHFSQRYVNAANVVNPTNYKMQEQFQKYLINHTIVCYDHLEVLMSQTPILPAITQQIAQSIPGQQ